VRTKTKVVAMEKYEMVKDLGFGNFGLARLMRNKQTNELVAVKFIDRGYKVHFFFFLFSFSFVCLFFPLILRTFMLLPNWLPDADR
jgi:hypothetical protein